MESNWLMPDYQPSDRVITCACGRKHTLETDDSVCSCGQIYNAFGQRLNPPSMWDEQGDY